VEHFHPAWNLHWVVLISTSIVTSSEVFFVLTFVGSIGARTQGLHHEPRHQPFFMKGFFFFETGSHELFALAGLILNHPDLCLLSSYDYRHLAQPV
jgi:hypothetical protein